MEELLKKLFRFADWKAEKHVPVIEAPSKVKKGELIEVKVSVGKEIKHPNTTEHHIKFIELLFWPEGENFPYLIARAEFTTHGESIKGPNTSTIYAEPTVTFWFKTEKSGKLIAISYCNIHGYWISTKEIKVE